MARIKLMSTADMEEFARKIKENDSRPRPARSAKKNSGFDKIPEEMRSVRQWVGYVLPSKNPINVQTMSDAKSSDPETWSEFDQAVEAVGKPCQYWDGKSVQNGTVAGVGFMFSESDPFVGVDLDHVLNERGLTPEANSIVRTLDSYSEISVSGSGLHIIVKAKKPGKKCKKPLQDGSAVEMYDSGRYFAITGNVFQNRTTIESRAPEIREIYTKFLEPDQATQRPPEKTSPAPVSGISHLDDGELLEKARNQGDASDMFVRLYDRGDVSDFLDDSSDGFDGSKADLALARILAFWSSYDVNQIDRLFRGSALYMKPGRREKWDRRTGSTTYGNMTIEKAISSLNGKQYTGKPGRLANISREVVGSEVDQKKDQKIDLDILKEYLKEQGISIRLNELTKRTEISGLPKQYEGHETDVLPPLLNDQLSKVYKGVTTKKISELLLMISVENKYNPVTKYLDGLKWDKKDYFSGVFEILDVVDPFSKVLVRKWFIQCVAMAYNKKTRILGADGVLVLQGDQGIGKTSFFRELVPRREWFTEGLDIDMRDKDSKILATSNWIAELGELDSTLKREQASLKAFITQQLDEIRLPYASTADQSPRMTSFCATVNEETFLRDKTGARRWWVVKIKSFQLMERLQKFTRRRSNIDGLWAQAVEEYRANPNGFRLTPAERDKLNELNFEKEVETQAEIVIQDVLNFDLPDDQWDWWTVTDLKENCNPLIVPLKSATVQQIGVALKSLSRKYPKIDQRRTSNRRETFLPVKNPKNR